MSEEIIEQSFIIKKKDMNDLNGIGIIYWLSENDISYRSKFFMSYDIIDRWASMEIIINDTQEKITLFKLKWIG